MVKQVVPRRGSIIKKLDFSTFGTQGHEQREPRPAVVLSPGAYNKMNGMCIIVPVTTQIKGYPFEVKIPVGSCSVRGVMLADQARLVDWRERELKFEENDFVDEETMLNVANLYCAIIQGDEEDIG